MLAMRYSRPVRLTLLVLATLILLGGCGQKGSLYLPDEQQQEEK
jgi:predicted small lipoprotein YifL